MTTTPSRTTARNRILRRVILTETIRPAAVVVVVVAGVIAPAVLDMLPTWVATSVAIAAVLNLIVKVRDVYRQAEAELSYEGNILVVEQQLASVPARRRTISKLRYLVANSW